MVENILPAAVFRGPRSYLIRVGDSRLAAGSPAPPSEPADVAPAPRQASGIKCGTGILFAWSSHQRIAKSTLSAAVLRGPGFWDIYLQDFRLAEGSPAPPSEPADVAAPPRASGKYLAAGSHSASSSHERIAENILPAVVLRGPRFCYICFEDVGHAAGSPAPPPGPADVAPAPPQASASLPTTGANITVISMPSVVLEDTAVPDTSVDVQPMLVPPRLSARSPAQPAAPADAAPAPPRSSGLRSAWSTRGCIVEGLLSAVVFVYSVVEVVSLLLITPFTGRAELLIGLILFMFFLSPSWLDVFCELKQLWTVPSAGEEGNRVSKYPDLDGVDLFEYHCFQCRFNFVPTLFLHGGMNNIAYLSISCPYNALVSIGAFILPSVDLFLEFVVHLVSLGLGCLFFCRLYVCFIDTKEAMLRELLKKWKTRCVKQPRCRHVRVFLLAGGTIYAVLLHLSPAPSKWTWSLFMAHSARLLSLLVALRGDNEGVADAAAEVVGHVLEAV
ncbi:unnamed protein product [Ectocarpus sp. 8 AP-2014]